MSTLQALLNLGLVNIGSDDSRLAKLEATGEVLVAHLLSSPALVIPATLIAIDRDIDAEDPLLTFVDERLVNEWKTIRNTHVNRPRELLRSIIIHALSDLGARTPPMAALIWHTAFSPINHQQARFGKEGDFVRQLLQNFHERVEEAAPARVCLSAPPPKQHRNKAPLPSYTQLTADNFSTDIARSVGPHDQAGTPYKDPNPHWPNEGQPWSDEFTPRMTAVLVKAVNLAMNHIVTAVTTNLQSSEQRLTTHMESRQSATDVQLDVLWWFQAKYSPSLRRSYRDMSPVAAAVAMAHDLSMFVPAMSPTSVTYVLGEAVAAVAHDSKHAKCSVATLLDDLRTNTSHLRELVPNTTTANGRVPLWNLVAQTVTGNPTENHDVQRKTGIAPDLQQALLKEEPDVVHFSGHGGGADGIMLHSEAGTDVSAVSSAALARLFAVLRDNIRLVVLNACYSEEQARALVEEIDFVVGMTDEIGDEGARVFAAAFYRGLAYGRSVQSAFDLGLNELQLEGLRDDESVPVLLIREGVNASDATLL